MRRIPTVMAATIALAISTVTPTRALEEMGRAEKMLTDKGCVFYMYTGGPKTETKWPFAGACTPGQPISGKGTLSFGNSRITGTWVKGVFHGPLSIESRVGSVGEDEKTTYEWVKMAAVADMGCLTSVNGKSQTQPGCKEAMAKIAK